MPSIINFPLSGELANVIRSTNDVFPEPDAPTIATELLLGIVSETESKAGFQAGFKQVTQDWARNGHPRYQTIDRLTLGDQAKCKQPEDRTVRVIGRRENGRNDTGVLNRAERHNHSKQYEGDTKVNLLSHSSGLGVRLLLRSEQVHADGGGQRGHGAVGATECRGQ